MPRENRKRGRKHKKQKEDEVIKPVSPPDAPEPGPSWIQTQDEYQGPDIPYGFVDQELKLYLRNMDVKIVEWSVNDNAAQHGDCSSSEIAEERRTLLLAVMSEIRGKELQLATDPECSTILERVAHSMDDFVRRVFMDSLSGSYVTLVKHCFGSHVCQTMFDLAAQTLQREASGAVIGPPEDPGNTNLGDLRTLTQLVLDAADELLPLSAGLVSDPFGSHVLRTLLRLLSASSWKELADGNERHAAIRSAKSVAYKARQAPMKSMFEEVKPLVQLKETSSYPNEFWPKALAFHASIKEGLSPEETRALALDKVASPLLQTLVKLELRASQSDQTDSLVGRLHLVVRSGIASSPVQDRYIEDLFCDVTASHLIETFLEFSPTSTFNILWSNHIFGLLKKLVLHPVANFVVAKAILRLDGAQLENTVLELTPVLPHLIVDSRTSVIRSLIERAGSLQSSEQLITEAIISAFSLDRTDNAKLLVPCCLSLKVHEAYEEAKSKSMTTSTPNNNTQPSMYGNRRKEPVDPLAPSIQGSLLLQSLVKLSAPHNDCVIKSLLSISKDELMVLAQNPVSSRVLDAFLESPTVALKDRRRLILAFVEHFHILMTDRVGSRVGDRLWEAADPYLQERIGKSVLLHEDALHASQFGKYFVRNANLGLLKRKPEEWKTLQAQKRIAAKAKTVPEPEVAQTLVETDVIAPSQQKKRKRKREKADEIDALFESAHKGEPMQTVAQVKPKTTAGAIKTKKARQIDSTGDKDLEAVFHAIKTSS